MKTAEYEVFKGIPDAKPRRLGTVCGSRQRATDLMYRMYARLPGDYFVRDTITGEVVVFVERKVPAPSKEPEPHFDIFRGLPDRYALWVETVEGLASARQRMEQIAAIEPDKYFVFCRLDHSILAYAATPALEASTERNTAA
jgi:hypothetical protein